MKRAQLRKGLRFFLIYSAGILIFESYNRQQKQHKQLKHNHYEIQIPFGYRSACIVCNPRL